MSAKMLKPKTSEGPTSFRRLLWMLLDYSEGLPMSLRRWAYAYQILTAVFTVTLLIIDGEIMAETKLHQLYPIEVFAVVVFGVEYIARLYACVEQAPELGILGAVGCRSATLIRAREVCSLGMLVDLVTISALLVDLTISSDAFRGLLSFRVVRLFMLVERNFKVFGVVLRVLWERQQELASVLGLAMILLLVASNIMYYIESPHNEEMYPDTLGSLWWAAVCFTTVGYGDVYPVTPLGRLFGCACAFVGVGLFAMPSGIIASGFVQQIEEKREQKARARATAYSAMSSSSCRIAGERAAFDYQLHGLRAGMGKRVEVLRDETVLLRTDQEKFRAKLQSLETFLVQSAPT